MGGRHESRGSPAVHREDARDSRKQSVRALRTTKPLPTRNETPTPPLATNENASPSAASTCREQGPPAQLGFPYFRHAHQLCASGCRWHVAWQDAGTAVLRPRQRLRLPKSKPEAQLFH